MKKTTFLLLMASLMMGMLCSNVLLAQGHIDLGAAKSAQDCFNVTNDGFQATFSFAGIDAQQISTEKGVFSQLSMDGTIAAGNVGDPSLPTVHKLIAVPYGATNITVDVKNYSVEEYNLADYGIDIIAPQQASVRKDQKPEEVKFAYNANAYTSKGFSERPLQQFEIQGTMRGIQVGSLTINPVNYDPTTNTIRVYNNIQVEVRYNDYDKAAAENEFARTASIYFKGIYSTMFNWRDGVYDEHPDPWNAPVRMLVIANRMFEDVMQEWINWKTTKGFYMDVNYTDQIGSSAAAIRSFIQERYAATAPTFIIIFGDSNQVPASYTGSATSCVADLRYMSVDNDYYPEMLHSRMCAENVEQMSNILYKTLLYDKYEFPDPTYLDNVLLIAGWDGTWNPRIGKPTIQYATNYYYNAAHGFANVYEFLTQPYNSPYASLNTGVGFVNYTAHGSNTSWADPQFTVSQVNSLTNVDKPFLAMGNCCQAADWGISGSCLGEAMIRSNTKAAYAYIGSCPSSYWYEDYYFGVGATNTLNAMPTYEESSMGCYDATWEDDAYNTVAAIPFIGNIAVCYAHAGSYDGSVSDLYYWEAYHALGDGSIMPYRTNPTPNDVQHLPTLPIGMDSYEITAAPGSYAAITKDGEIYGAGLIDETGTTAISITPITSSGDVIICVTHPQHQPYLDTVTAAAMDGAYMVYDSYEAQHTVTPGSWVPMNINVKNVGSEAAQNVTVTLSTESDYVSIVDSEAFVETIPANETYLLENLFSFDVAVNVPDNEKLQFLLTCTDEENTWESKFNVFASAPNFSVQTIYTSDLAPGENGIITFNIANEGGSDAYNAIFEMFSGSPDITLVEDDAIVVDTFLAGTTRRFQFNILVSENCETGSTYEIGYLLSNGHYSMNGSYILTIGTIVESFETGDFSQFDWVNNSAMPWTIVSEGAYDGTFCAKSGQIGNNGVTDLVLTVDILADGEISFYRKVSSESNYDKLHFYIDNNELDNWSGSEDWTKQTYSITTGTHTFKWSYQKDYSVDSGQDCAWIDYIEFPPTSVTTALAPVRGLDAVVEGYDVTLTWTPTQAPHYMIRRNGEEIGITDEPTFTDTVEDGVFTYCVIAMDDNGNASTPAFITVNVGMVGVEENDAEIKVYPNPVKNTLILNVNADYHYGLFNNMGQEVMNGNTYGEQRLNVSELSKGIYVLRITTGTQNLIQKIIVE